MAIVYDEEPTQAPAPAASSIKYDEPSVFDTGAAPVAGAMPPAAPPDKYQQAAIAERERLLRAKVPLPEGFTRRLGMGPAFGWGDEIMAAATTPLEMIRHGTIDPREGYRYGKAREDLASQKAQEKTGLTGDVLETVGGLALGPTQAGGRQIAAALGGGGRGIGPAAARMAGYGVESGILGAVQGAGNARTADDIGRDALRGGAFGAALGAPFGALANVTRRSTAAVPSEDELFKLGARDFRARDRAPVRYYAQDVADKAAALEQANARKYGRDVPQTRQKLRDVTDELDADIARAASLNPTAPGTVTAPGQAGSGFNRWQATVAPRDIASLRREIYDAAAKGSPTDERAGVVASKVIDRILSRPNPASLAQGSPRDAAAVAMLDARGRGNFAGGYRARAVQDAIDEATTSSGRAASGLNFENVLRQKLDSARRKDAFGKLNPAEEAQLEQLIVGAAKANAQREFGNMLGGGGGLGRAVVMGGGAGLGGAATGYFTGQDPVAGAAIGLGLGLTGRALRTHGNRRMQRDVEAFSEQTRRRTPEYLARAANAPTEIGPGLTGATSNALRNTLTLGGGGDVRDAIAASLLYNTTGKR